MDIEKLTIVRYSSSDYSEALFNCGSFWAMKGGEASLMRFLENPDCLMLAARVDGKPAGQILGYLLRRWDNASPMLFLYSIDVKEEFRRQGVGKQLVAEFNRVGREEGCSETFVLADETNTSAMNLYNSSEGIRVFPDQVMYIWNHDNRD